TSAAVAHRRPWYYTIDLWVLYKEVNDDEEDSAGFFDNNNSVNSPSMLAAGLASFDFSQFKDCIHDFDAFLESISCDNSSPDSQRVCTVLADSGLAVNSCAVCSETFDLKWHEEEEEWRLMNAVRFYPTMNAGKSSTGGIYHPLCLRDHLIQR